MKQLIGLTALVLLAACATSSPYGPQQRDGGKGYTSLQIESDRFRVAYTASDATRARDFALLRAAEVTLQQGADWFRVVSDYTDREGYGGGGRGTSVSIGGSTGSGGYSNVGVGIGIGLGGGRSGDVTSVLEIITGSGPKPDTADVYDARALDQSLRAQP